VCLGQTWRGSITGLVQDASDARVSDARVTVANVETGKERAVSSDPAGEFAVSSLAPGNYRVTVERDGFAPYARTLTVLVNQSVRVDVRLQPGSRTEQIEVSGRGELVKHDEPSLSTVVDNTAIRQLPLDGRNFYELSLLAPGTAPAAQGSAGSVRGDFAINVNGLREDSNNFLLDGVYNGDPKLNGVAVTPPPDAIREFEVLTHTYDASFGRNAGGQINVVLQSGSNEIHGTAWEFFRNAELDARNYFAPRDVAAPRYQRNQFGFSIGGPVKRNRTFFFGDYEGTRAREGITAVTNVPAGAERNAPLVHPIGRALVDLYPLPNRNVPGQNYVSSPVQRDTVHHFDTRLDHMLSANAELALRYSCADRSLFEPFAGSGFSRIPGFGNDIARRAQNVMASETHAFSPALLNELRLGYTRVSAGVTPERGIDNSQVGLPVDWSNDRVRALSFISLPGYSPLGHEYNNPQHGTTNTYQLIDQATYSAGRHLLKFGGDVRVLQQNAFRDVQARGFLTFFGVTGSPVTDLLMGIPVYTGRARLDNHQNLRSESYSLFVHDTWRVSPSLTFSAGVRYEYTSPGVDVRDRANLYDPATGQLVPVGQGDMPRSGYLPDRNNFAPRVAIAWSPGERKTVLRAAYGIYYDQSALAPGEGLYFSAPYYDFRLYAATQSFPLLIHDPFPANYPFPLPGSALAIDRNLRTPYAQHWNLNVQREIGRSGVAEIGYVGSKGTHLIAARDINQPRPSSAPINLRPNPRFDDVNLIESRASSIYHALQAKYQQRMAAGLTAIASYTFGKSIDEASGFFSSTGDPNFPQDSYNLRAERGRSNFDVRHRMSLSYTYDLPFRGNRFLSGWQTNGVWTFQTGRPFTVALLPDIDNSNTGRSVLGFGANDRPNVVGEARLADRTPQRWFNTQAFAMPPYGTFGDTGRNGVEGPSFRTVNVSLLKNTSLTERLTLQLRAEAFNLFDRTNFNLPDNYFGSPSFGSILSAGSPRRLQLGVKFLF
jgi:hypothetical protein